MRINQTILPLFLVCLLACSFLPVFRVQAQAQTYLKIFEKDGTSLKIPSINIADTIVSYRETRDFYQFNITLEKPLASNRLDLPIETNGLEFYYQPPLNEELKADGERYDFVNATHGMFKGKVITHRPENVTCSYAVYMTTSKANFTGKLYHIYRPLLIDTKGMAAWANLSMTKSSLSIIMDDKFLTEATYPIVVDPTFGFEGIGGSTDNEANGLMVGCKYTTSEAGSATTISAYTDSGAHIKAALYSDNAGAPNALLASSSEITGAGSASWNDLTIAYDFLGSTPYWLVTIWDGTYRIYYDSGTTNQAAWTYQAYASGFPNPFGSPNYLAWKISIHCDYTTGGGAQNLNFSLTATTAISISLSTQKNLSRRLSETTVITSSVFGIKSILRSSSESVASTDSLGSQKDLTKLASDSSTVTDESGTRKTLTRVSGESTSVTTVLTSSKSILAVMVEISESATVTVGLGVIKTLRIILSSSSVVTTILESTKAIHAIFVEISETISLTATLEALKHISATLIDLLESAIVSAVLNPILPVIPLTTEEVLGIAVALILIFFSMSIGMVVVWKNKKDE